MEASNVPVGSIAAARLTRQLDSNSDYCLSFDYHMNGKHGF